MYDRELEFFAYDFDRKNFESILKTAPAGPFRQSIVKRLEDTVAQMDIVDRVYAALKAQVTDEVAHAAAVQRAALKRRQQP